ncbi:MAG: HD domain-containing protein [Candidatus Omnitrophica bacterium]|nr:HD domain-containing protein [Candidatus Omnitrophota bacterium]
MKEEFEGEIYFTPKQAAKHFNLNISTIKNYIYANKLRTLRTPGGHHRIRKSELLVTLGDPPAKEGNNNLPLMHNLCLSILAVFKTIGPVGDSLIIHSKNVSALAKAIAKAMDLKGSDVKRIEMAALIHDIGHIAIDKSVLLKSGMFTREERELIKEHPAAGERMLASVKELKDIKGIIIHHHEWVNGKGYPHGLKGEEINIASRIIAIAEAYDSMVSPQSYKKPVSKETAISELMRCRDIQFDGTIVEVFTKII